jgi:hypothetical protein
MTAATVEWPACRNPECGFNVRIDNGELSYGRTVGTSQK